MHELYTRLKKSKILLPLPIFPPSTYVVFTRHNVPWLANFTSALRFRANYATFIIRNTSSVCNGMKAATRTYTKHTCRARGCCLFIAAKGFYTMIFALRVSEGKTFTFDTAIPGNSINEHARVIRVKMLPLIERAIKCDRNYRDRSGQFIWERYFAARCGYRAK